jgi:hypothetical protein
VNIKKFYNSILKINKNYNKIKKFTFKNRILVQKNFAIKPVNNRKISLLKN